MENVKENIAPKNATSPTASENDWMLREATYQVTMNIFRQWLSSGLISKSEYTLLEDKTKRKYLPKIGDLLT